MTTMNIGELLASIDLSYDSEALDRFEDDMQKGKTIVIGFAKKLATATAALGAFLFATSKASDSQGLLAHEINETVEAIGRLQFANAKAGGTADDMAAALRQLAIAAADAARGTGSGVEAFARLGISSTDVNGNIKKASLLFREIAGTLGGYSRLEQLDLIEKLGLSGTISLLQKGTAEIDRFSREAESLGVITGNDATISREFQSSLTGLWSIIKNISRTIAAEMLPLITSVVNKFVEWFIVNKKIISLSLKNIMEGMVHAVKLLAIAFSVLLALGLIRFLTSLHLLFLSVAKAVMVMWAAVFTPAALAVAAFLALLAIIQDIWFFFNNRPSALGDIIEEIKSAIQFIDTFIEKLTGISISDTFKAISKFFFGNGEGVANANGRNAVRHTSTGITNNAGNVNQEVKITISGAGNPAAVGEQVVSHLRQAQQTARSTVAV